MKMRGIRVLGYWGIGRKSPGDEAEVNTSIPQYLDTRGKALVRCSIAVAGATFFLAGCHTDMWVQPKYQEPLAMEKSPTGSHVFPDSSVARPLEKGTVPRDHLQEDDAFYTGYKNGKLINYFPLPISKEVILRGQDRFTIYCVPCHGQLGNGQGMIARRGFELRRPVGNYHTDRLRKMPIGHFFDVMTNGYGAMFSYASRVEPQDRWAIAAYIRVLQLSQNASVADLTPDEVKNLDSQPAAPAGSEQPK